MIASATYSPAAGSRSEARTRFRGTCPVAALAHEARVAPTRAANSLNGHDTIAFSGSGRTCVVLADAPSLQFGMSDFAIFVVARYTNIPMLGGINSLAWFWRKTVDDGVAGVSLAGNGVNAGDT